MSGWWHYYGIICISVVTLCWVDDQTNIQLLIEEEEGAKLAKEKLTQDEGPFVGPLLSWSEQQLFTGNWHE